MIFAVWAEYLQYGSYVEYQSYEVHFDLCDEHCGIYEYSKSILEIFISTFKSQYSLRVKSKQEFRMSKTFWKAAF